MNDYPHFFRTDKQANLVAGVVTLVTLFDTRDDTITVKHVVHKACADGFASLRALRARVDRYENDPRVVGITLLRNKLFAHRDREANYDKTFKEAGVRPKDLFELSDETFEIIGTVADTVGALPPVHDTIAPEHAERMLRALRCVSS